MALPSTAQAGLPLVVACFASEAVAGLLSYCCSCGIEHHTGRTGPDPAGKKKFFQLLRVGLGLGGIRIVRLSGPIDLLAFSRLELRHGHDAGLLGAQVGQSPALC